ncbi:MAG: decaprenyl-phosphate phosphoribosyltransferase [Myxococcota bacterium]
MLKALILAMRPAQWVKNFFVFAPLIFSQQLFETSSALRAVCAFFLFSFLSGSIYMLNDLEDVEKDRLHPHKKHRPIASGALPISVARLAWPILSVGVLLLGFWLSPWFALIALIYALFNVAYSFKLKHIAYLDVLIIANGFLLRLLAGAAAIQVEVSRWLVSCGFLFALYLALGKRRHELSTHGEQAGKQRAVLKHYNVEQLDLLLGVVASLTVLAYCGYTLDSSTLKRFQTPYLIYTIPFIVFGITRFLQLIERGARTESPTQELLRDLPSILNGIFWVIVVVLILYTGLGQNSLLLKTLTTGR